MKLIGDFQIFLYVADTVTLHNDDIAPVEKVVDGKSGDEEEPEPQEDEDFLVEQVDGQNALDSVTEHVLELTDLEVAECHTWEAWTLPPWVVGMETFENFKTIHIVIGCHESIQQEELTNDVADIQNLDEKEKAGEESTASFTADNTAHTANTFPHGSVAVPIVVTFTIQPFIDVSCQMLDDLLSG